MSKEFETRNKLHNVAINLARTWGRFASAYHEPVFVEDIHFFGALVREINEMVEKAVKVQELAKEFEEKCIATHDSSDARTIMQKIFDEAVWLAEESAQIGGVAIKGQSSIAHWKDE